MASRIIKEGKPMDPVQVGDIITLELKNGYIISDLIAVPTNGNGCDVCYMYQSGEGPGCKCYNGWVIKNPRRHGKSFYSYGALCCTKPMFATEDRHQPEFCRFIKLDSVLEDL